MGCRWVTQAGGVDMCSIANVEAPMTRCAWLMVDEEVNVKFEE